MAQGRVKKTSFFCSNCGFESAKWVGNCPSCHEWNTMVEEPVRAEVKTGAPSAVLAKRIGNGEKKLPRPINDIESGREDRLSSGIGELNRVLGGGVVKGSMVLVGGDPGIGKSTLLLQVCRNMSGSGHEILYVSGEESLQQIKLRADRLGRFGSGLKVMSETDLDDISRVLEGSKPEVVIIDSIQTMFNEGVAAAPGSVSQIRETTAVLLRLAKSLGITIFIIGHVTKEGAVAGPRVLEHMVDTVLYFEGEPRGTYRILRSVKNRFGSTDEIGVFEMGEEGLKEVENPSEFMLSGRPENESGSVAACCIEGTRPLLIEIQALVCESAFGIPRRQSDGADINRVNLLMAVLEKRAGLRINNLDAYVNIAGGLKVREPSLDLGIVLSIASSFRDIPLGDKVAVFGEVGLSGEVRGVSQARQRVNEAARLGFNKVIMPSASIHGLKKPEGVELIGVKNVAEALSQAFPLRGKVAERSEVG